MEKTRKSKHFLKQPEYPGGPKALSNFIYSNLKYPQEALDAGVEGVVLVEYGIDYLGNVTDARILQSLGYGCDEEAIRVIRLLKFEVGRNRGVKVVFHKKVQVAFKKPQPAPAEISTPVVTYQYVVATRPSSNDGSKKENSYSYTITFNN